MSAAVELCRDRVKGEVFLLDGGSNDGTPERAAASGAVVIDCSSIAPEFGPLLGKGDSIWRASLVLDADLVVFVDGDLTCDVAHLVTSLLEPLVARPEVAMVKAHMHRRGWSKETGSQGRVTQLCARPAIGLLRPDLAGFQEPLSGQVALRSSVLRDLEIFTGYGVEIGMLADVVERFGTSAVEEVDVGLVTNPGQTLHDLTGMAEEVLSTLIVRAAASDAALAATDTAERARRRAPVVRPSSMTMRDRARPTGRTR